VQVNADSGPAFLIREAKDLELDGVSTRKPLTDAPVIRLDHCPGAILRSSRAFPGTRVFLSTLPGELSGITLVGNVLRDARQGAEEIRADFWKVVEPATEKEPTPSSGPSRR
jgi:hypothetical protein